MVESEKNNNDLIGKTVLGVITNVTNFGAFVSIEGSEEGLVHISEIADEYITDINKFVQVGDKVNVKILNRNIKNKLELSIKKAVADDVTETDLETIKKPIIKKAPKSFAFEDKLTQFMKRSEERQIDIRRNLKNKQGLKKQKK